MEFAAVESVARRNKVQFAWICAIAGVVFAVTFQQMPIAYFADAGHDDGWYTTKAYLIASGQWLGAYDQYTLMKGPGYPLFLVLVSASGIPLALAEAALFALALGLLCLNLARLSGAYRTCAGIFVLTLWHPVFLVSRVIRDAIYPAQLALVLAFAIGTLFLARTPMRSVVGALSFGIAFAWYWLTREEGAWLLPGLAGLLVAALACAWRDRARLRRIAIAVALMSATSAALIASYGMANRVVYGSFELVDFKDAGFMDALDALYSVQVGEPTKYLPVPRRARLQIYEVSPHFAQLRGQLDGTPPNGWAQLGCQAYPQTCGDIAGGWWFWALRDAAAGIGKFSSPAAASQFFAAVAAEVRAACASGALTCRRTLLRGLPALTSEDWRDLFRQIRHAIASLSLLDADRSALQLHSGGAVSSGPAVAIDHTAIFLNSSNFAPATATPARELVLQGWYMDAGHGWFRAVVRSAGGVVSEITAPRAASPDLVSAFHDPAAGHQRFRMPIRCTDECTVELRSDLSASAPMRLSDLRAGQPIRIGDGNLHLDNVQGDRIAAIKDPRPQLANAFRLAAARAYALVGPVFYLAGLAGFLVVAGFLAWRRSLAPGTALPLLVASVFWIGIAARIVLLALIHVTLFPAVTPLYLIPAYYLTPLAAGMSLLCLARLAKFEYRRRTGAAA